VPTTSEAAKAESNRATIVPRLAHPPIEIANQD